MSDHVTKPGERAQRPWVSWLCAALVGTAAALVFGHNLRAEPHFADESAYISQSYFADLWLDGDWQNAAWLTYPAMDLPPLPKYLIGAALRAGGFRRPGPEAARAWYGDINTRCETDDMLEAARWPIVFVGAAGCVAIFALGTLAGGYRVGVLAALLLMANPLYRMQARRAMSDVPAEAFLLASAAVFLWGWRRSIARGLAWPPWLAALAAGTLAGLSTLAKLNGVLALFVIAAWVVLAWALPRVPIAAKAALAAAGIVAAAATVLTFVALNPYLTARPDLSRLANHPIVRIAATGTPARVRAMLALRMTVPRDQQAMFPTYALRTLGDKAEAVVVQGFGRFGLFGPPRSDSTRRFDWSQDRGALVWLPWVAAGALCAGWRGRSQLRAGEPPAWWAILAQAAVALVTVTVFIPLAWDRYYLSLQAGSALLAAGAGVAALDGLLGLFHTPPEA